MDENARITFEVILGCKFALAFVSVIWAAYLKMQHCSVSYVRFSSACTILLGIGIIVTVYFMHELPHVIPAVIIFTTLALILITIATLLFTYPSLRKVG